MHFVMRAAMAAPVVLTLAACGGRDRTEDRERADRAVPAPASVTDSMGVTGGMAAPMDSTMRHDSTGTGAPQGAH